RLIAGPDALDALEPTDRAADVRARLALSGTETVEVPYALAKFVRQGFGSNAVLRPEETSPALDRFRLEHLSDIRHAQLVVVLGDEPVVERAPVVDLWLKAARRAGAEVVTVGPPGDVRRSAGTTP